MSCVCSIFYSFENVSVSVLLYSAGDAVYMTVTAYVESSINICCLLILFCSRDSIRCYQDRYHFSLKTKV